MKQKLVTKILRRQRLGDDYYLLCLENPFSSSFQPGQFVMISLAGVQDPFLKRPYSIYRAFPPGEGYPAGEIQLLIREVGSGSRQMGETPIGSKVEIIGPLGNGFRLEQNVRTAIFVAGGIGVAPFVEFAAAKDMAAINKIALIGGRSSADIQAAEDLKSLGVEVRIATEDGSAGTRGRVTDLLEEMISEGLPEALSLYCCGPEPMMKAVGGIAKRENLPCLLSLEAFMGCGFGVCLGCVVEKQSGGYIRVCKEGPVASAEDLSGYHQVEEEN